MRSLLLLGLLPLAACATAPTASTPSTPSTRPPVAAPLASSTEDEAAFNTAIEGYELALDGIDLLLDLGQITPKSPRALQIAGIIDEVNKLFLDARAALAAGNKGEYKNLMDRAGERLRQLQGAL